MCANLTTAREDCPPILLVDNKPQSGCWRCIRGRGLRVQSQRGVELATEVYLICADTATRSGTVAVEAVPLAGHAHGSVSPLFWMDA